jgi:hypothetical protein
MLPQSRKADAYLFLAAVDPVKLKMSFTLVKVIERAGFTGEWVSCQAAALRWS